MIRKNLKSKRTRDYRSIAIGLLLFAFSSCVQHTLDPTQPNNRLVLIQAITSSGNPVPNVMVTLRDNNSGGAIDYQGNTGDTGAVSFRLAIPTFGHDYALDMRKSDPSGVLLFDDPIYPLNLKCTDTIISIVLPVQDTTTKRGSICGVDDDETFQFFVCADTTETQTYVLTNCGVTPYTIGPPSLLSKPFLITSTPPITPPATLAGGASITFQITFDARVATSYSSARVTIPTTGPGNAVLTLEGTPLHDCSSPPNFIVCGTNSTSDTVRFDSVCQGKAYGPQCVPFVNPPGSGAVTVTMPTAPSPFTYTVTDKNGANIKVPGGTLTLQQGDLMTACISITPPSVGPITGNLIFPMQCAGGGPFNYTIPLSAIGKVCSNCQCLASGNIRTVSFIENTPVGKDTTFTTEMFINGLDCPVTISNATDDHIPSWTILSFTPPLPATVLPNGSVNVQMRFAPTMAGMATDHLKFQIASPGPPPLVCNGELDLDGLGCHDACAKDSMPPEWLSKNGKPDSLYFKLGTSDSIPVSASSGPPSLSDTEYITLTYPDTGCSSKTISIVPPKNAKFTVTPMQLVLSQTNKIGQFRIFFTAPQIAEIRQTFTTAGEELKYTDLLEIIDPSGCTDSVPLKAVVDTFPSCKEFGLAQYEVQAPDGAKFQESYPFGAQASLSNVPPTGIIPSAGDIYFDKNANLATVRASSPGFHVFNNNTTPICTIIPIVTAQLTALNPPSLVYSQTISPNLNDWIVVSIGNGAYAVIQVTALFPTDAGAIQHIECNVLYEFIY